MADQKNDGEKKKYTVVDKRWADDDAAPAGETGAAAKSKHHRRPPRAAKPANRNPSADSIPAAWKKTKRAAAGKSGSKTRSESLSARSANRRSSPSDF